MMLVFISLPAFAARPWSAQEAKENARTLIDTIILGQKYLEKAMPTKDKQSWQDFTENDFYPIAHEFHRQDSELGNRNMAQFGDCESALAVYQDYAYTFFLFDSNMNRQSRNEYENKFKKYFASCKIAAGWRPQ
jgi:hypothetical protein